MDVYLTELVRYLATQSWQIAGLTLVVAAATWALRHRTAHVRYLLWLIVLAKCLVPPFLAVPLKVLPEKAALVDPMVAPAVEPAATESASAERTAELMPLQRPSSGPGSQMIAIGVNRTARKPPSLATWAGLIWIGGAGLFLMLNLLRALRGQRWLHQRRRPLPDAVRTETEALLSACGGRPLPPVWIVDGIGQPFVWGVVRGSVYLPTAFVKTLDPEHRRHVLAHELSHVRRCDAAVNLLQTIAQGLFWFHPFVWWANRQIRREREKCCDEMAVAHLGTQARDYCHAVVETLASAESSGRPIPSLAVAGPARNLEERIKTMLRPGKRFYSRPSGIAAIVVIMAAFLIVPTAIALTPRGNPPDEAGHAGDTGGQTSAPPQTRDAVSREKLNEILNAMLHHDTAIMPIAMHVDIEMWSFDPERQWQHNEIYSFEQRLDGRRIDSIMTRYRIEDGQPRRIQDSRSVFTGSQFVYRQQDGASLYPPEEAQRVMAHYHLWGGVLLGYLEGDHRPVAAILQDSADVALHERTENVDGTACYVIEGRTNHGTYQLWVDPEHSYRIRRSIVDKGPGDMFFGKPMSAEPTTASMHMEISGVTVEKIGNHFIPTAETMTFKMVRTNGTECRSKMVVKRSDIDLRPDFEALEAFVIPDGIRLDCLDPHSHTYAYQWHDGKAVSIAPGGGIIRGRVRFTGHADLDTVLKGKRKMRLLFWPMPTTEQEREQPTINSMEVQLEKDGSFYVEDIPVGRYHLHVSFTEPRIEKSPSGSLRKYIIKIAGVDRQLLIAGEMEIAGADREFSILEESDQAEPQTVDLGVLEMAVKETPEPSGETALPSFNSPTMGSAESRGLYGLTETERRALEVTLTPNGTAGEVSERPTDRSPRQKLPEGWSLEYDDGITGGGTARHWVGQMADDLASLEIIPAPADSRDKTWKNEDYRFEILSPDGESVGTIDIRRNERDHEARMKILKPGKYSLRYRRKGGRSADNFRMHSGPFDIDLSRPGMYKLRFTPKLGRGRIAGTLGGCYALNFERIGTDGPNVTGLYYQNAARRYVVDGLPPGQYRLSASRQSDGSNIFISRAQVAIASGATVTVDMPAPPEGACSLGGKLLGKPQDYKTPWQIHPQSPGKWYVLLRDPGSGPIAKTPAYQTLTMDSHYVIWSGEIVQETEDTAAYSINGIAPGEYTVTAIEDPYYQGYTIERQQSKPLILKASEDAILDFDLRLPTVP